MSIHSFVDAEEVSWVMTQIPFEQSMHCMASQQPDGTWKVSSPDDMDDLIEGLKQAYTEREP